MYIRGAMKIGLVPPVKPSHPYLGDDPAPLLDLHYLRISPWLWFSNQSLIPSQKGLFEMNPGVRRWSGAEEATGCRLLASPHHLPRSGQA